ncbi:MAG: DUF5104 domain-containing protein [Oscillospiraceae bacterium]|nr:DUF5104 domain-containing protein [Oscillospiraceae bacterium]
MNKKSIFLFIVFINILLLNSCFKGNIHFGEGSGGNGEGSGGNREGGVLVSEDKKADARMEQIVLAINNKDKEALKSLFSSRALDETNDIDVGIDSLFELLQGDINTWERVGWSSSESIEYGKSSLMIRFAFDARTDKDVYQFFVIDYDKDNINPDNQGVYMLELIMFTDEEDLGSWQDRMRAGIYIH